MTLEELLDKPELIKTLNNAQLTAMLTPYFPATRKAVLPEEKYKKQGLEKQLFSDLASVFADEIAAYRKTKQPPAK